MPPEGRGCSPHTCPVIAPKERKIFALAARCGMSQPAMLDLTDRTLITETDIRSARAGSTLRITLKALVTPLAADLARERHITLERVTPPAGHDHRPRRRIAIGAD